MKEPPYGLSKKEYRLVSAIADAIIPSGSDPKLEPGAEQVGTKNYIDSIVLEFPENVRKSLSSFLMKIQEISKSEFGIEFENLPREKRVYILEKMLLDPSHKIDAFFIRALCLEGYYSDYRDPWYTGKTAWDVVGFKGKRITGIKKDFSFLEVYKKASSDTEP